MMAAGRECAAAFTSLLQQVHTIVLKPTAEEKAKLATYSRDVAMSVGEVVKAAEASRGKGGGCVGNSSGVLLCQCRFLLSFYAYIYIYVPTHVYLYSL